MSSHIAEVTSQFDAATKDQGMSRADHVAAAARIHDVLTAAMRSVRRLDLIVQNELSHDNVAQAVWKQGRRIQDARASRGGSEAEPAAPGNEADTLKPQAA